MSEREAPGGGEAALDQQLDELIERGYSIQGASPDHEPSGAVSSGHEPDMDGRLISVSRLRTELFHSLHDGLTLTEDIYDESGVLLLAAGSRITARFLQLLRDRGITRVRMGLAEPRPGMRAVAEVKDQTEADGLHTPQSRELDDRMASELQRPVILRPVKGWRRPRISINDLKSEAVRGVKAHEATSEAVARLCESFQAGRRGAVTEVRRSVDQFVDMAAVDYDLLPFIVALQHSKEEYLFDHCVNVALVSMAIAYQLGLDRQAITEIGLAGMLHDIGMLRVPESIRRAPRSLTDGEWREIHRHPLYTLDMFAGLRGIPLPVKFVAYQAHERIDGQGYPRGRAERQLHRYAEIVAIADVHAAMIRPRPYREAMVPYLATRRILVDGRANKYDRGLVRAYLDTVSLFPIGSRVSLSNGCAARTLRANPGLHTRPVVEEVTADGCPTGHIIDLSDHDAPRVVKVPC